MKGEDERNGKQIKKEKFLVIDPKKIKEGMCKIVDLDRKRFSICKEKGKLKIFPTIEDKEE